MEEYLIRFVAGGLAVSGDRYASLAAAHTASTSDRIAHTVRYTELSPDRFKGFWRD